MFSNPVGLSEQVLDQTCTYNISNNGQFNDNCEPESQSYETIVETLFHKNEGDATKLHIVYSFHCLIGKHFPTAVP